VNAAVALFTILGAVANVVMATAAVAALSLWRKQGAGASITNSPRSSQHFYVSSRATAPTF
jgi:hypothetical protein